MPELREHERLQLKRDSGEPSRARATADVAEPHLGSAGFGDLLIERRRRREALDAHIASLSSIQRAGMIAMVRHGLGLKDRDWQARYDELVAALDDVERAVHKALGVTDIAPYPEHAVRVGG